MPNSNTPIDAKDIGEYDLIVRQISKRLSDTWALIPPENMPVESP